MDFFEKLQGGLVGALGELEEFPASKEPTVDTSKVVVTSAGAGRAQSGYQAWYEFDFEGKKQELQELLQRLSTKHKQQSKDEGTLSTEQLLRLCSGLIALPDPAPLLENTVALSQKVLELEASTRELSAAAAAAAADHKEVSSLVEKHRALETAHKELQEAFTRQESKLADALESNKELMTAKEQATRATAEVTRLNNILKSLREEHESAQAALFEATSKQEVDEGSRQRELDSIQEELDKMTTRCAELELERDRLSHRLAETVATVNEAANPLFDDSSSTEESAEAAVPAVAAVQASYAIKKGSGALLSAMADEFWERQLKARNEQVATLQEELEAAGRAAADMISKHEAAQRVSANQLSAAQLTISQLQAELRDRPTIDTFKELQTRATALQQLVDVQIESEGWDASLTRHHLSTLGGAATAGSTHALLQERNRALSSELASLKRASAEQAEALTAAVKKLEATEKETAAQKQLIERLELDLTAIKGIHAGRQATNPSAIPMSADSSTSQSSAAGLPVVPGAEAAADSGLQISKDEGLVEPSTPPGVETAGNSSLLEIVTLQRDRFRQRVSQLEEEKGAIANELATTKRSLEATKADNVALFEKVKYLEQYSHKSGPGAGGRTTILRVDNDGLLVKEQEQSKRHRYTCGPLALELGSRPAGRPDSQAAALPGPANANVRVRGKGSRLGAGLCFPEDQPDEEAGPEARYSKAYEARVNPFSEFQNNELESRVRSLPLHDRAVFAGSKLLMGSRLGRLFLAMYILLLHVFIMVLVYYAMSPRTHVEYVSSGQLAQQAAVAEGTANAEGISKAATTAARSMLSTYFSS